MAGVCTEDKTVSSASVTMCISSVLCQTISDCAMRLFDAHGS